MFVKLSFEPVIRIIYYFNLTFKNMENIIDDKKVQVLDILDEQTILDFLARLESELLFLLQFVLCLYGAAIGVYCSSRPSR